MDWTENSELTTLLKARDNLRRRQRIMSDSLTRLADELDKMEDIYIAEKQNLSFLECVIDMRRM